MEIMEADKGFPGGTAKKNAAPPTPDKEMAAKRNADSPILPLQKGRRKNAVSKGQSSDVTQRISASSRDREMTLWPMVAS